MSTTVRFITLKKNDETCRYDLDNSGAVDQKEMNRVMMSIYSMVEGNVTGGHRGNTNEKVSGYICVNARKRLSKFIAF